jgi:integration host factor subunit alpha
MALTKSAIISKITDEMGFSNKQSTDSVETILETIKSALASGDDVLVSGFGKLCVREKEERLGRNPVTGESMMLPPRRVVSFKISGKLRDRINGKNKIFIELIQ